MILLYVKAAALSLIGLLLAGVVVLAIGCAVMVASLGGDDLE